MRRRLTALLAMAVTMVMLAVAPVFAHSGVHEH